MRNVSMDRGSAPVFFMLNVRFTVKFGGLLALGEVSTRGEQEGLKALLETGITKLSDINT